MFDSASRYYRIRNATYVGPNGDKHVYKRRRCLPRSESIPIIATVGVRNATDRLDLLAARALGDPKMFWRICDANDALNPFDLLQLGGRLRIPAGQVK